MNKLPSH